MRLPLFPLHTVLFPGMRLPLHIFEPRYRLMIDECLTAGSPFGVVLIRSGREVGEPADPHPVGTTAHITGVERLPDGRINLEVVGQQRFQVVSVHTDRDYLTGTIADFPLTGTDADQARRLAVALRPWLGRYLELLGEKAETAFDRAQLPLDPANLGYLAAIVAQIPLTEKQHLLSLSTASELLAHERRLYRRELALLRAMLNHRHSSDASRFSPN